MFELHIVTPFVGCYNYTKEYLASIRCKTPFHLKLIDNKPEFGIFDLFIQEYNEIFDNLKTIGDSEVIYMKNDVKPLGVAESWNEGIVESLKDPNCKYILITNNDILLADFTIDKLIEFQNITGYDFVTPSNINDGINKPEDILYKKFTEHDLRERNGWGEEGPDFSCFLVTPNAIKTAGFFDENYSPAYFEDNDYHRRMNVAGVKCARSLTIPYFHYGSMTLKDPQNQTLKDEYDKNHAFDKNKKYFQTKWGGRIEDVMNGLGYSTPFDNVDLKPYMWKGYEKFETIRNNIK